jgi:hypothetical protein
MKTIRFLCAFVLVALASAAASAQYTVTYNFDDPSVPRPGMGTMCTVEITSEDTLQGRTDAGELFANLRVQVANSPTMQQVLREACRVQGGRITLVALRDDPTIDLGAAAIAGPQRGQVFIDLGDRDALFEDRPAPLAPYLQGTQADVGTFQAIFVTWVLAHEIDHLRDEPGSDHLDPPVTGRGVIAAPDVSANAVLAELDRIFARLSYVYVDPTTGNVMIDFRLGGDLFLDASTFIGDRRSVNRLAGADVHELDEDALDQIPDRPCGEGRCWTLPGADDRDLDGVRDADDNCDELANPQQSDVDEDGVGAGCDEDGDGDGENGGIERAMGSSDFDSSSLPEHFLAGGSCEDGEDNDGDGIVDAFDPSCAMPATYTDRLPSGVTSILGGVPSDTDVLRVDAQLVIEGELTQLWGVVAIQREDARDGTMRIEVIGAELSGESASSGFVHLVLADRSRGIVIDDNEGGAELPATVELAFGFAITDTAERYEAPAEPIVLRGRIDAWPLHGANLYSDEAGEPVPLLDRKGEPTGRAVQFFGMGGGAPEYYGCFDWLTVTCAAVCTGGVCCRSPGSGLPDCSQLCEIGGPYCS